MSSHGSFTSLLQLGSGSGLESPFVQFWESLDPPKPYKALTIPSTVPAHVHGGSKHIHDCAASPHILLTEWNLTDLCEFSLSRISRPKCASTAELFGHLPGYSQYAHPTPPEEEDGGSDDDDTPAQDIISPLKERQRRKL